MALKFLRLTFYLTMFLVLSTNVYSGTFGDKHVLIVGIDGCRPDRFPTGAARFVGINKESRPGRRGGNRAS